MIHARFMCQSNVLVDKCGTACIAGLGNASILLNMTEPTYSALGCDMYAFGIMAWEVQRLLSTVLLRLLI